jgi:hypothetical protein
MHSEYIGLSLETMESLQRASFEYFMCEANPRNGLVIDKTKPGTPSRITVVGMALAAYPVGVERDLIGRSEALQRTLVTLRFFNGSEQSTSPVASGYKGFYYHFLDMNSGTRAWLCELSTIETTFLIAGTLAAGV